MKKYAVTALGELLIDFTENGQSGQGNPVFEANPGGAPCNVLAMLAKLGHKTAFIGKVGNDFFGEFRARSIEIVEIAKKYGGGGHSLACGASLSSWEMVDEVINDFINLLNDGDKNEG